MDVSLESNRKKLGLPNLSLYTVLQILSISIVDKKPILGYLSTSSKDIE
jgi:hypothetical protein